VADLLFQALAYPGIRLLYLTPRIALESTQLPGTFHRDARGRWSREMVSTQSTLATGGKN